MNRPLKDSLFLQGKLNCLRQVRTGRVHMYFKRRWSGPRASCDTQIIFQSFIYSLGLTDMSAKPAAKGKRLQNSLYNSFSNANSLHDSLKI